MIKLSHGYPISSSQSKMQINMNGTKWTHQGIDKTVDGHKDTDVHMNMYIDTDVCMCVVIIIK